MPEIFSLVQWVRIDRVNCIIFSSSFITLSLLLTKLDILTDIAFISGGANLRLAFAIVPSLMFLPFPDVKCLV